jgi:hypothetical protein
MSDLTTSVVTRELSTVEPEDDAALVNVIYSDDLPGIDVRGLDPYIREVAAQVGQWAATARENATGSMIDRRRYEPSENPLKHMEQAHYVLRTNDLVGGFQEIVEGIAFQGTKWESADADISDLWNQMAAEQNLDALVRKMSRECFVTSQVIVGTWWDRGDFTVRGTTEKGHARKKRYEGVWYPRIVTILESARVVPVGLLAFGQEQLAWIATSEEMAALEQANNGDLPKDEILHRFFLSKYHPTEHERLELATFGINPEQLILLNPTFVRRYTLTRSDYERWAPVRMRQGVFQLHDLRQQLMEADRVTLVGTANYILLVKKGDKDTPGTQEEVRNVRAGFRTLAKVPVIFSDHRLSIEIIAPKADMTLNAEKYDLLDARIIQRLINNVAGSRNSSGDTKVDVGPTVITSITNQRHMLRRFLEMLLSREVLRSPLNADIFKNDPRPPSMVYTPANLTLDDAASMAAQIIQLRTMREISRESLLEFFGLDQEAEALRMELEELRYDDVFKSVVPFSAPGQGGAPQGEGEETPPVAQAGAGGQGGRPKGGGQTSKTNSARTSTGKTKPKES